MNNQKQGNSKNNQTNNEVIQVRCVEIQTQAKQRRQKKNQETRAVDHRDTTTEKSADYSVVLLVAPKAAGLGSRPIGRSSAPIRHLRVLPG